MEKAGLIEVVSRDGATVAFSLAEPFRETITRALATFQSHTIMDGTIDDDLVTLLAVQHAVANCFPQQTRGVALSHIARIVFDSLMKQKYGDPPPREKTYVARAREFREEVTAVRMSQAEAEVYRDSLPCACGSGLAFAACCKRFLVALSLKSPQPKAETILVDWLDTYSPPISQSFRSKARPTLFRISAYLDCIVNLYFGYGFTRSSCNPERADRAITSTKNNIMYSLYGALSCLSQGLFLQSGIILRSLIKDCLVLVDLFENEGEMERLLRGEYTSKDLIPRTQRLIPKDVRKWYECFSANFTHFGPAHPAPYLPAACYPDNFVLVVGLQDLVRAVVTFHVVLERVYFDRTANPMLWKRSEPSDGLLFDKKSPVFAWAQELGKDLTSRFPPHERKEGFIYDDEGFRLK